LIVADVVVPLGDRKFTKTTPEVAVVNSYPIAAIVASVELATGVPPPMVTLRPVLGVETETTVPAAIGFKRGSRP
jgi:hypothetical protein